MHAAYTARTAAARARIAATMLLTRRRDDNGGRDFDTCFESGDGTQVYRILIARAAREHELLESMRHEGFDNWVTDAEKIRDTPDPQLSLFTLINQR